MNVFTVTYSSCCIVLGVLLVVLFWRILLVYQYSKLASFVGVSMSFQWNMLQLRIVVALLGGFGDRLLCFDLRFRYFYYLLYGYGTKSGVESLRF